ncbi:hypothetical protein [Catenulispora pinisilvae]|uniref:hypothetical protein n=1 Tax=Catenulispora pinisilvae TaxID=2705253 RepID=UPI001891C156|nr:hypothetical protein [Catenulispora pinisilvae]
MAGPTVTRASFTTYSSNEITIRNKTKAIGAIGLGAVAAGSLLIGAFVAVAKGNTSAAFVGTPIGGFLFYVCWLVGWRATIRLRPEGIVVENCIVRLMVPWRLGRQFVVSSGIKLRLLDGRMISTWAFQGSLGAQLNGYSAFKPIRDRLQEESDKIVYSVPVGASTAEYRWRLQLPDLWILFALIGVSEAVVALAYLLS